MLTQVEMLHSSEEDNLDQNPVLTTPVIIDRRLLSRTPSPEIAQLCELIPTLYKAEIGKNLIVCPTTGMNFLGALLAYSVKEQLIAEISKTHQPNPKLSQPIEVIHNVPLFQKKSLTDETLGITVDNVLIKYMPGKTAGVVLTGPYAGLLLEPLQYISPNVKKGMAVHRIWNEDAQPIKPYDLVLTDGTGRASLKGYDIYKEKRDKLLEDPRFLEKPISKKLFYLLNEAGIPVNPEEFHTSTYAPFNRLKI